MLTTSELKQVKHYLELYSKKDTQLLSTDTALDDDYISIIHQGANVIITIRDLEKSFVVNMTEPEFDDLVDSIPTEGSNKFVRSNGIWHAINDDNVIGENQIKANSISTDKIQDNAVTTGKLRDASVTKAKLATDVIDELNTLHSEAEKFNITVSVSPTTAEITGNAITATISTGATIDTYGDAGSRSITPDTDNLSVSGGTLNNRTWTLPNNPGTYTATYRATKGTITLTKTANTTTYLRKYFGFAEEQPDDITTLSTSHASTSVSCTVVISANGTGFKHIYFAVPNNMTISNITQPDSLNAPLAFTYVKDVTRTIGGNSYTYKLYESTDTIDSSISKRLTIS